MTGMAKKQPFTLVYSDEVKLHLRAIDTKYHSLIDAEIGTQLLHDANVETRNRKPLKRTMEFGADRELRLGPDNRFRVFNRIDVEKHEVRVLAVGVKDRNRLIFGGKELET
jgi:hypothetical protein